MERIEPGYDGGYRLPTSQDYRDSGLERMEPEYDGFLPSQDYRDSGLERIDRVETPLIIL